jgi:hypothetical protein
VSAALAACVCIGKNVNGKIEEVVVGYSRDEVVILDEAAMSTKLSQNKVAVE